MQLARQVKMRRQRVCLSVIGVTLALVFLVPLTGCNRANRSGTKTVVATTGMIGDLVRRVAGDTVRVQELMGAGVDPHLYKPTGADRRKLEQADLILFNGLHLEGNMVELLESNPRARAISHDMPPDRLLKEAGQSDPHVWFDVSLWTYALNSVEKELAALDPAKAEDYHKNAAAYRTELESLHEEVKKQLSSVPKPQRVMVTAHDAFRYFGKAYDIEVHGLQGISTADEAGLKEVSRITDLLAARKIKAIFVESSVPPDRVQAVVEQCRARGHSVKVPDAQLYSDAMGAEGTTEGTYPGMIRHNVRVIANALK